jgi:Astacin (Peptidase family M12A)
MVTKSKEINLGTCSENHEHDWADVDGELMCCTPKSIPDRLIMKAAEVAAKINPVNMPMSTAFARTVAGFEIMEPLRIAAITTKYWGPTPRRLTVSFMENTPADLRARILTHLNAWTKTGCISFVETAGIGDVRISRGRGGYYSYLGTDVLLIPKNRQTMNLDGFTMNTPESEFKRVIRHETGHTLGFPHEHMRKDLVARIDPQKAYKYFLETQGWDKATVDAQVLTPLDERTLMSTPSDQTSIMCYQLPGSITFDGRSIIGGIDINATDYAFVGQIYPKPRAGLLMDGDGSAALSDEWDESEDVEVYV